MKPRYLRKGGRYLLLFTVMILGALLVIGCGSDGATGPTGATGPEGPPGPPGQDLAASSAETCSICHGAGKIADIAVAHPDDPAFTGSEVMLSNIALTNNAGTARVNFDLTFTDGTPVTTIDGNPVDVDMFRFMMADLVPAGTPTDPGGHNWGTFDTAYWERWVYERTPGTTGYPQGVLTDNGGGNYTYDFFTAFGAGSALADAPDLDHTPGASHVQRLFIRFDGRDDPSITQRAVGFFDFIIPLAGNAATALDPQRQFITSSACEQCHSPNWERAAHASGYRDIKACVLCHSPLGFDTLNNEDRGEFMQTNDAYASIFFHKIHGAIDIPFWTAEGRIGGQGYSAVSFPQVDADEELRDCAICHNNDAGEALGGQAALIDNWKTEPSREICVSCHTNVDFDTGTNHGGGAQANNQFCTGCHPPTGTGFGQSIANAHDITPRVAGTNETLDPGYLPENIREFDVTLSLSPAPANGTHYVAGDVITVTATLADHATGTPVAPSVYTTPRDSAGVVGGGLREAYVQFSGPRARPVPVLATDTFSDPNWDGDLDTIEDEHEMFVGLTDPQIKTDATGFKYQTLAIPADVEPGTYIVRVVFADYGRKAAGDYHIDSFQWQLIQIGTATVEPKVAGDACVKCHGAYDFVTGTGTAPFHDERHSVAFDTDQCLTCHHDSGHDEGERLHGVPLANRVHAVHAANAEGDIYNFSTHNTVQSSRDWTHVTFPREIMNCNTCHNSQFDATDNTFDGTYKTLPYMMPCSGCHVGMSNDFQGDIPFVPGVVDHMRQNGGPWLPNPNEPLP